MYNQGGYGGMMGNMGGMAGGYGAYGGGMGAYGGGYGMGGRGMGRGSMSPGAAGGYEGGRGGGPGAPMGAGGSRPRQDAEFVEGKLFLGGLDNNTTKEALVEYCQQWGELADYVLMEGRGFGFVTFSDPASAQTFLEHREHIIDGKRVEAKAAVPRNSSSGPGLTKKMFVGGTGEVSDEDFKTYFDQFGEIEDCVILRKPDGGSRGFGFVTYKDEISVEKCLVMQHQLNGRNVELKRAIRKEEMGGGGYSSSGYGGGGGSGYAAGGGGGAGGPMRTGKAPDWICPSPECRNKNFGWREVCNRCETPKPANPETTTASSRPPTGGYGARTGGYEAGAMAGGMGGGMGGGMSGGMGAGMGAMGGMGSMAMGGMGMGGMAGGMGGMGYGMPGMAYGMGMGGMGMGNGMGNGMGGYASQGGGYGSQGAYGRASGGGRGAGAAQGRYRPY